MNTWSLVGMFGVTQVDRPRGGASLVMHVSKYSRCLVALFCLMASLLQSLNNVRLSLLILMGVVFVVLGLLRCDEMVLWSGVVILSRSWVRLMLVEVVCV